MPDGRIFRWRSALRPTLRQLMVLVVLVAVVAAAIVRHVAAEPGRDWRVLALVCVGWVVGSVVVLAVLTWVLDRPGNARRWLVLGVASLVVPGVALTVDLVLAVRFGQLDRAEVITVVAINVPLLFWALRFVPAMWPSRCPACRSRALIPVRRGGLGRDEEVRECAECLGLFRRSQPRPRLRSRPIRATSWIPFEPGRLAR